MTDPARTYIDASVELEPDVRLLPGTILEGRTVIGAGSVIGPDSPARRHDRRRGHGHRARRSRASRRSVIGSTVGPCVSLRAGHAHRRADAHIGTFVETKNADIGEGAKVPHLAYIGDAEIGARANIGAGTITANYDGREKHRTIIGADVRDRVEHRARRAGRGRRRRVHGRRCGREPRRPAGRAREGRAGADRRRLGRARGADADGRATAASRPVTRRRTRHGARHRRSSCCCSPGSGNEELSAEIAECLDVPLGDVALSTFANGEIYCRYGESIRGADVFVIQSHCEPINDRIMEQLIMIDAAKRASAKRITAVCPFYGYARQDRKAEGREPITARLLADMLTAAGADRVVTVDLHTGQIQGFFDFPVDHLTAVPLLAEHLAGIDGQGRHGRRARRRRRQARPPVRQPPRRARRRDRPRVHRQAPAEGHAERRRGRRGRR